MPSDRAVRMMRRVISPRLAIRILLNGGLLSAADVAAADDDDLDENVRFAASTAWGRAR